MFYGFAINSTFSFSHSKREVFPQNRTNNDFKKNMINSKIASNFSYFSYLLPSKDKRIFYQKGAKHLHEYLDIRKIIKRLQDLDKLKMILLTENQRRLFELIPKPDVVDSKNKLSLESLIKYQKKKTIEKEGQYISKNMKKMAEDIDDPINKRIWDCLDKWKLKNDDYENEEGIFLTVKTKNQ